MTFIPDVGDVPRPDHRRVHRGGRPRAGPDPAGPAGGAALRDRRPARGPTGQHDPGAARRRARGRGRVPRGRRSASSLVNDGGRDRPGAARLLADREPRRSCRRRVAAAGSAPSTTCSTSGPAGSSWASSLLAVGAVALGHHHRLRRQPVRAARPIPFSGSAYRGGLHDLLDRRDDQQHQLDRRPRRPVVRDRASSPR